MQPLASLGLMRHSGAGPRGAGALRWGVQWWRVEPALGRLDFSWTDEVAAEMDRLGLVCVVDVLHYGTPDWLAGSFVDPTFPVAFERYA